MNKRYLGAIIILLSIFSAATTYFIYEQGQNTLDSIIEEKGSCFLDDGTCIHAQSNLAIFILSLVPVALFVLGLYILIFDRAENYLREHHIQVSTALENAKQHEKEKDEFFSFLNAFNDEEQSILKVIREQEGITQSTLRYKTGISKTRLSLILASLEERGIVSRKKMGKTKQVFLRKVFP